MVAGGLSIVMFAGKPTRCASGMQRRAYCAITGAVGSLAPLMSIKVLGIVWDNYPGGGSKLLTMLALADWADDAGGRIYPSMRTLANKIRMSERQAIRIMRELCDDKGDNVAFVEWINSENRGGRNTTNRYRIKLETLTDCQGLPQVNPDISSLNPDIAMSVNPDIAMSGDPLEPLKPSTREFAARPAHKHISEMAFNSVKNEPRIVTLQRYIKRIENIPRYDARELTRANAELDDLIKKTNPQLELSNNER